ncbi:hypothetical protein JTE90_005986 [Oedothorax gibbosus]|uniref:G-protein coupled receptors family 2 profile 2 domain-containing protein n=1 Tax=Oedothorax gibbosus TaxID=931172 RepID=A0AAV6UY49_9ARAC|nr:hypothetical protein JTE90_005986 [Oedothorax gibbosus]
METTTVTESSFQNISDISYFDTTINIVTDSTIFNPNNNITDDTIFTSTINYFNDTIFTSTINYFNDTNFNAINNITNGTNSSNAAPAHDFSKYFPLIIAEMALSCLCLIFSIAVYCVLPEFKNVHGKNLISMSVSLLITFVFLICDLLWRKVVSRSVCFNMAVVIHVTFLANFFWTNVMAFDIWKSLTDMKAKGEVKGGSTKFLKYSIYAWTMTLLTSITAAVLDLTNWVDPKYRPNFGTKRCWLNGRTAFYFYFNLPVGLILLCNLCLFLATLRKLVIIKRMTAVLNVRQQQQRLYLYLKLFLIMGITWTTEYLPLLTGIRFLYAIAGMMTALHGVFLFFIFVCKKKILVNFFKIVLSKNASKSSVSYSTSQQTVSTSNKKISVDKMSDSKF